MELYSGGVVDNIRRAAQKRVTVMIRYEDTKHVVTERETEPYEIRDGAYWGYDIEKGTIKRFTLTGVLSAQPTESSFSPRWTVKF